RVGQVVGGAIIDPAFPESGSGKYEVSNWTLILRFSNSIDRTVALKYDKNEPHRFLLHTTEVKRTGSIQPPCVVTARREERHGDQAGLPGCDVGDRRL